MYTELHCHSAFSFLDGASLPEQLALTAADLGYPALALTDHNGLYGSMAFAAVVEFFNVLARRNRGKRSTLRKRVKG